MASAAVQISELLLGCVPCCLYHVDYADFCTLMRCVVGIEHGWNADYDSGWVWLLLYASKQMKMLICLLSHDDMLSGGAEVLGFIVGSVEVAVGDLLHSDAISVISVESYGAVTVWPLHCAVDFRCWYVERMQFCSGAPNAGCEIAADASSCLQFIADAVTAF